MGLTISNGEGDPFGWAKAKEAEAKASVDITQILADLQRDIETMRSENERLTIILEHQDRAESRADFRTFMNTLTLIILVIAVAAGTYLLIMLGARLTQPQPRRRRSNENIQ